MTDDEAAAAACALVGARRIPGHGVLVVVERVESSRSPAVNPHGDGVRVDNGLISGKGEPARPRKGAE